MNREVDIHKDVPWIFDADIYLKSQEAFIRVLHGETWEDALEDLLAQWELEAIERGESNANQTFEN